MALSLICLTVALFRVIIGQSCDVSQYCTQTAVLIVRYILTRVETGNWDALVGGGFVMRYVEGPSRQGVLIAQGGGREKNSVSATGWIVERRLVNHDSHLRWTPELARACHAFYPCHHHLSMLPVAHTSIYMLACARLYPEQLKTTHIYIRICLRCLIFTCR